MPDDQLMRIVPILTCRELAPVVAFYEWLGFHVTGDYGNYVVLGTDVVTTEAVEVHLSRWDGHDPRTAGTVYLRVHDASVFHGRLHRDLQASGRLFVVPASGFTDDLSRELTARQGAGEALVALGEGADKPWGMHEFGVIDPAGWLVRVGSFVA